MSDLNTRVSVALDPSGFTSGADKMKTGVDNVTDSLKKLNDAAGQTQIPVNGSIGDFSNIPGGGSYSNQAVLQAQQQSASNAQVQQVQQMSNGSIGSSGNGGGSNGSGGGGNKANISEMLASSGVVGLIAAGVIESGKMVNEFSKQWLKASDIMDVYATYNGNDVANLGERENSKNMVNLYSDINLQRERDHVKYKNSDYIAVMNRLAQYGYDESEALESTSKIMKFQNFGAGSRDQLAAFMGLSQRFGDDNTVLNDAYKALQANGMQKGQFDEFLSGIEDVMESGISKGFVKSSKEISKDLTLLYNLSGESELWKGQYGAEKLQKMNSALENATGLGSVNDVLLFQAMSGLDDTTKAKILGVKELDKSLGYINDMMILERGVNSDNIGAIFNTVKGTGGGVADQIARYKNMFGVNYTTAKQIYDLSQNYTDESAEETAKKIGEMVDKIENRSEEQRYFSNVETMSDTVKEVSRNLFSIKEAVVDFLVPSGDRAKLNVSFGGVSDNALPIGKGKTIDEIEQMAKIFDNYNGDLSSSQLDEMYYGLFSNDPNISHFADQMNWQLGHGLGEYFLQGNSKDFFDVLLNDYTGTVFGPMLKSDVEILKAAKGGKELLENFDSSKLPMFREQYKENISMENGSLLESILRLLETGIDAQYYMAH